MNTKEKTRLKSLLSSQSKLESTPVRKASLNSRTLNAPKDGTSNQQPKRSDQHSNQHNSRPQSMDKQVSPKKASSCIQSTQFKQEGSKTPSAIFRSPRNNELSSCKSINFEKMLFRNNDNIYKEWDESQNLSKWEKVGAGSTPKHENFFKIVYGTANLETNSHQAKTPVLDKAKRTRDFSSQIETLPGPRVLSAARKPPPVNNSVVEAKPYARRDQVSNIFSGNVLTSIDDSGKTKTDDRRIRSVLPNSNTAAVTINLTRNEQAKSFSKRRNEIMTKAMFSTPMDYFGKS